MNTARDYSSEMLEKQQIKSEVKQTTLVSKNITVCHKRTSVRLEPEMWSALNEVSKREACSIHDLCTLISIRKKAGTSMTAAIRVFLMLYYKAAATEDGHQNAGHGSFLRMKERAKICEKNIRYFSKSRTSKAN